MKLIASFLSEAAEAEGLWLREYLAPRHLRRPPRAESEQIRFSLPFPEAGNYDFAAKLLVTLSMYVCSISLSASALVQSSLTELTRQRRAAEAKAAQC